MILNKKYHSGFLILLLAVISLFSGCQNKSENSKDHPDSSPTQVVLKPIQADSLLRMVSQSGSAVTLVNVWATWCQPCREEFPDLLKTFREFKDQGMDLILVSADFKDQLSEARRFLAVHDVDFTTYYNDGDEMTFINKLNKGWSGTLPATFIYDSTGTQVDFWQGKADYSRLASVVRSTLNSHNPGG